MKFELNDHDYGFLLSALAEQEAQERYNADMIYVGTRKEDYCREYAEAYSRIYKELTRQSEGQEND